jgi:hypothetical protein
MKIFHEIGTGTYIIQSLRGRLTVNRMGRCWELGQSKVEFCCTT